MTGLFNLRKRHWRDGRERTRTVLILVFSPLTQLQGNRRWAMCSAAAIDRYRLPAWCTAANPPHAAAAAHLRRMMGQTYRRTDTRSNSAVDRGGRSVCQSNDKRRKYCQHCPTTHTDRRSPVCRNERFSFHLCRAKLTTLANATIEFGTTF